MTVLPPTGAVESAELEALRFLFPNDAFSPEELLDLVPLCRILDVASGKAIIEEGAESDNQVYFLLRGEVSVSIAGQSVLRLSRPGDIVGEMSLITSARRSATVRTEQPCRFLVMRSALELDTDGPGYFKLRYYFSRMFNLILTKKLSLTSERAVMYEKAVKRGDAAEQIKADLETELMRHLQRIRLFSHLVEGAMDAIVIVDPSGRVREANAALGTVFGIAAAEAEDQALDSLVLWPPSLPGGWAEAARRAERGGWSAEVAVRGPGGEAIPADCSVSLVRESRGEPLAYSVMLRDIRERKRYEQRILEQSGQLEQANRALREMDRLKGNFLTLVSHELRTPITAILAFAETMTQGMVAPEEHGDFIRTIHQEAVKLSDMVNKVLAITKMESGQMMFSFSEGDLRNPALQAVAMMRSQAEAKGLALIYTPPPDPVPGVYDPDRINEALKQLLDNALRYTSQGSVTVSLAREEKQSLLIVEDTGKGMDSRHVANLSRKFDRLEDVEHHSSGLGLGLPLCYLIAKAHGGDLRIESTPGRGTKVSLVLPAAAGRP
jgi:PAS domain S-box-containing protein